MLNERERKIYQIITKVVNGEIKRKDASIELNLSIRQIDRLINLYYSEGEEGFIHKNRGKANPNKKDNKLIEELETLYLNDYPDYNFQHFYEDVIFGNYNISYDVMLKYFTKDDIISPLTHKETVKEYNDKMKNAIKDNKDNIEAKKIKLFKSRILEIENHYYQMLELENRDTVMIKESKIETKEKEHHKYIPPTNHPWRKNMMLKH